MDIFGAAGDRRDALLRHATSAFGTTASPGSVAQNRRRFTISVLLSHHGLALPSAEMWHEDPERYDFDFEALSAIALPLRSTKPGEDAFPSATTDDSHPEGYGITLNAVFELSSEALALPVNADRRFRRLVSKYRLQVVDRTKSTICTIDERKDELALSDQRVTADPKLSGGDGSAQKEGQAPLFAEGEPRWMLWSLAESCS
ncbi:hypothetical protein BCR35DRAFT_302665 [Leucosporidium creatinivorum]|uniref:Uncharacterized protein n=1 Tax=Leucosporidium creatinivorum TaxID=106004 RepID=A0A1Y2FRV2_9BASI|nr:hypothetical protein BCR35DRAFT_302665 [Leucosporidium creatinivorum]